MNGETITRLRADGVTNPYSGQVDGLDWTAPDELNIDGCAVAEGPTLETAEVGSSPVTIDCTVYTPFQADIEPLDRVVVRGRTYDVQGHRIDWRNPHTGSEPGSEIRLRRVAGK